MNIKKEDLSLDAKHFYDLNYKEIINFDDPKLLEKQDLVKIKDYMYKILYDIGIISNYNIQAQKKINSYNNLKIHYKDLLDFTKQRRDYYEARKALIDAEIKMINVNIDPKNIQYIVEPTRT